MEWERIEFTHEETMDFFGHKIKRIGPLDPPSWIQTSPASRKVPTGCGHEGASRRPPQAPRRFGETGSLRRYTIFYLLLIDGYPNLPSQRAWSFGSCAPILHLISFEVVRRLKRHRKVRCQFRFIEPCPTSCFSTERLLEELRNRHGRGKEMGGHGVGLPG